VISRWNRTDPAGQYWSPYMAMGNNPGNQIDPDGAFSRFGAWWRSALIPGSESYYHSLEKEWAVGWDRQHKDGNGAYWRHHYIVEGGPGPSFEGLGIDLGIDLHWKYGGLYAHDLVGSLGGELDALSVTMLRFNPKLNWEWGKGLEGSTWGFDYLGKDGSVKVHQGFRLEAGVDVKGGRLFNYDLNTGKLQHLETSLGGGTLLTEIKYVHNEVHGGGKLFSGLQEEVGKSFHTGGGLSHGLSAGFNLQITVSD
jgi:hypothetical protein